MDDQSVLVDQPLSDQRVHERRAAVGEDDTPGLTLEPGDLLREVAAGDPALGPLGAGQRGREDHLGYLVHHVRVDARGRRPHRRHRLIRDTAHDVRAGFPQRGDLPGDDLVLLARKSPVLVALRAVDEPVEGDAHLEYHRPHVTSLRHASSTSPLAVDVQTDHEARSHRGLSRHRGDGCATACDSAC